MYDVKLVKEILVQILGSTERILKRFEKINTSDDFLDSEEGMEKLDSICMQLIAIGESLKNLDKITNSTILNKYPQIEWKKAMAMRDIISHHYFDLNSEIVYDVCENEIPNLKKIIKTIIKNEFNK